VLGLVQGLTEFIPVSSSGHLQLVPFLFGWKEPTVAFDVAIHFGTLVAVIYVFRAEVLGWLRVLRSWRTASEEDRTLFRLVLIATIPAVIIGAILNHWIEDVFQRPVVVSLLLGVTGYLLMSAETKVEHRSEPTRGDHEITNKDAGIIGGSASHVKQPRASAS